MASANTVAELDVILNGRIDKLEASLKQAQVAIKATVQETKKSVTDALGSIAPKMQEVGRAMTMSLTLPLVAIGAASAKLAMDFDDAMAKIQGLAGASATQASQWRAQILDLANVTGRVPKELAAGMFIIASAGIRSANSMDILRTSAKLAESGMGDTKTVADALTSAINAYGEKNLSASKAADILVATVREGKMPTEALAGAIGRVLPVAAQLGVGFADVGAAIATMTRSGLNADEATTALRATLAELLKPAASTKKALAEIGMTTEDLRKELKENLIGALSDLSTKLRGNDEAMAKIFPNVRALTGVLSMTGPQAQAASQMLDRIRNSAGSAAKAFQIASDTIGHKWRTAMATAQAAGIQFGDAIAPVIQAIAAHIEEAAKSFQKLSPEMMRMIGTALALVAALGPLLWVTSKLIEFGEAASLMWTGAVKVWTAVSAAFAEAGGAAGVLGSAIELLSGPVGWVIAAATLIYEAWIHNWGGIHEFVQNLVAEIVAWWHEQLPKITEITQTVVNGIKLLWAQFGPWIKDNFEFVVNVVQVAWDLIKGIIMGAWHLISGAISVGLDLMSGHWDRVLTDMYSAAARVWFDIVKAITSAISAILHAIDNMVKVLSGGLLGGDNDPFKQWGDSLEKYSNTVGFAASAIGSNATKISDAHKKMMETADGGSGSDPFKEYHSASGGSGSKAHHSKGGSGSKMSEAAKEAKKTLEDYKNTVKDLTLAIHEEGMTEEWQKAIVEREYGKYKNYTKAEWDHVYALISHKEHLDNLAAAQQNAAQKAKDAADESKRAADEKTREITSYLQSEQKELDTMNLKSNLEKTMYEIQKGSLKDANEQQKIQAAMLAQSIDQKKQDLDLDKQKADLLKAAHEKMAEMVGDQHKSDFSQIKDYAKYMKDIADKMRDLGPVTDEERARIDAMSQSWGKNKVMVDAAVKAALDVQKYQKFQQDVASAAQTMTDVFMTAFGKLGSGFNSFFGSILSSFNQLLGKMALQWLQSQVMSYLTKSLGAGGPLGGGIFGSRGGNPSGISGILGSIFGGFRAAGGDVNSSQAYMVGENGPELFVPRGSGSIMNQNQLAGAGGIGGINITMTINTPDANSFLRSQTQVASQVGAAIQRATVRNQ